MSKENRTIFHDKKKLKLGRICLLAAAAYLLLVVSFYFLAGEQLHHRVSRGELSLPAAEAATGEMTDGSLAEQTFSVRIERLRSVSVQWGSFYRTNHGTATMALYDLRGSTLLAEQTFDLSAVEDGGVTAMTFDAPLEGLYGAPLRLCVSTDAVSGDAPALMLTSAAVTPDAVLSVNGAPLSGSLCLSASGEDYVWTGQHYWELAAAVGFVLAAFLLWSCRRWRAGKATPFVSAMLALKRYDFLIRQLVNRDFKTKYKRSLLGVFWSFLNPLLTMLVQYVVFSRLFRFEIENYAVYLLCGIVMFNYFSESCTLTLGSIVGNASLITKVYIPKYIYPLTRVLSSLINLLISMIPLLLVALASGLRPTKAYVLALFSLACIAVFCLGLGMLLCTMMVFFRDTQFLWGVLSMIWMYLTPIFYPASILPERIAWILKINPLYHFIDFLRKCIISGVSPEPRAYAACALGAFLMLAFGAFIFKKAQNEFVLYL